MVDNVSFIDEVNTALKHSCHPSEPAMAPNINNTKIKMALTTPQNHNNNNNNNNQEPLHPLTHGSCHQQISRSKTCCTSYNDNENTFKSPICNSLRRGHTRKEKDSSWLTRSVTQPALSSATIAPAMSSIVSYNTQSEETMTEVIGHSSSRNQVIPPWATPPSCPNSYDSILSDVSGDYFEARSSFSAPVELLSEFLSALMSRDYENALNLCQSILKYEPHNATALEFFPLLTCKIKQRMTDHPSSTEDDDYEDSDDVLAIEKDGDDDDGDDDEEEDMEGREDEDVGDKMTTNSKESARSRCLLDPKDSKVTSVTSSKGKVIRDQSWSRVSSSSMSASESMDLSVGIDSGRDSLLSHDDSEFTQESGDSLYSSIDSNLNIRSENDSLFSSTESGLTLESVIKSVQDLSVDSKIGC